MTDWFNHTCVKEITGAEFEDSQPYLLKSKRCSFILFFASWCGYCQNFKPEYIKFADKAQFVKVLAIDIDKNKEFMQKLNNSGGPFTVQSYPTLWIYKDGKPIMEYKGKRICQELEKVALKVCNEKCNCTAFPKADQRELSQI